MLKKYKSKKILSLLLICIILTTLIQVAYAADGTINITEQPTETLVADYGESPGTISVVATATNGAIIKYQWHKEYESGSSSNDLRDNKSSYDIPANLPGTYKFYCVLTADGCGEVTSEKTILTVNKIAYTGLQADTVYVKAKEATVDNIYILPDLSASDMTYTIAEDIGATLVTDSNLVKDSGIWKLAFNTSGMDEDTIEDIEIKINGGYIYKDSIFTLTVKAGKEPIDIIGIIGTNDEYSGTLQKGYKGIPGTGGFKGELNHHYKGRNETTYDSDTAPVGVGDYTVRVSIPENADYSGSKDIDFSIIKREITVKPVDYIIVEGQQLPSDIWINYFNFLSVDDFYNSISTPAVAKFTVSDSNTPGESAIVFEKEATLFPEKEKIYVLKYVNGTLEIQKDVTPSVTTYTVTVIGSYVAATGEGNYAKDTIVNIYAGSRNNYTFSGWTSSDVITFENASSPSTSFTMPEKAVKITANWSYNGGGGSGSDSDSDSGNGGSTNPTKPTAPKTDTPVTDETISGTKWVNPFMDIKEDSWFYEAVKYVYENDLMKGTEANNFTPKAITTRGMIVTILHRLEGLPLANASSFGDVTEGKYYANAVSWASENKIVNGYGNDKFGPEDAITREQLAVILMNYARYKGYNISAKTDLSKFDDAANVSGWALHAMAWANAEDLIQGDGNNLIPKANATRAEVAAILHRFVEKIIK